MLTANKPQSNRVIIPAGTHIARLIGIIHIGTVPESYLGETKPMNKIRFTFEFPDKLHAFKEGEDKKPLVHSQEYTLSMGKKSNLRPIVEGMIGTSLSDEEAYNFNFESLLNLACLVSIKHKKSAKGSEYAVIASTSELMEGQKAKEPFNEIKVLTYEKWNEEQFQLLPDFIKEKMKTSVEYKKLKGIKDEQSSDDEMAF